MKELIGVDVGVPEGSESHAPFRSMYLTGCSAVQKLEEMQSGTDEEIAHGDADEILLSVLRFSGQREVVAAYEAARDRVGFWYA